MTDKDIIKDSMTLHKVVTFRTDSQSIVSRWNDLSIKQDTWENTLRKSEGVNAVGIHCYQDFWNNVTLDHMRLNDRRTEKGLYNLHWLLPHELPIALNV